MADLGLNNTWISQTRVTHLLLIRFISFNVRLLFNTGHAAKVYISIYLYKDYSNTATRGSEGKQIFGGVSQYCIEDRKVLSETIIHHSQLNSAGA